MSHISTQKFQLAKHYGRSMKPTTRKKRRKEARLLKKARKLEYFMKVHSKEHETMEKEFRMIKVHPKTDGKTLSQSPRKKNHEKTFQDVRKLQLLEANKDEDKIINNLEKSLKIKKKKKKKIPKSFVDDGLDYILELFENAKSDSLQELDLSDVEDGLEEDLALVVGETSEKGEVGKKGKQIDLASITSKQKINGRPETKFSQKRKLAASVHDRINDMSSKKRNVNCSSGVGIEEERLINSDLNVTENISPVQSVCNNIDTESESKTEVDQSISSKKKISKQNLWEDIYGRLRDEHGNVIDSEASIKESAEKYLLPDALDVKKKTKLDGLRRRLKGLLNRLSESNMQPISTQIEEMYMQNSRNDMNETMMSIMTELVFSHVQTPPRLVVEQAMLIALMHGNIGSEVGAYFLQSLSKKLDQLFKLGGNYGEGKECDNILTLLCHLYNFKVVHSLMIYDIFRLLVGSFQEKDVELILLLLKNAGFSLRKDDPLALKEVIQIIQSKATSQKSQECQSRVLFMLDIIAAIRNNNMYKIPNYDPSLIEHMKKVLRGLLHKGSSIQELAISFEDLLKAGERGRWWIIGSAWVESDTREKLGKSTTPSDLKFQLTNVSEKILELAKKQHMNTEIRKNIFCIIMTAEDYMDAFEKLLHLGLKNQQEREIINVILHCSLHECNYNPFYSHLAEKFSKFDRKYRMALQFSLWDKFKELESLKTHQLNNLSHFLVHQLTKEVLPISVLKVIHFAEMGKSMVHFFRQTLLSILLKHSEDVCIQVFGRIAQAPNLQLLRESLRLFMQHFLLRNKDKFESHLYNKLATRVQVAEKALGTAKHHLKL